MACFPRIFHHRSKNSFSPRDDVNTDPIVNNENNSVQIGRYIRRDEKTFFTPLLTPNASEAQLQRIRSQKQISSIPTTPTIAEQEQLSAVYDLATPTTSAISIVQSTQNIAYVTENRAEAQNEESNNVTVQKMKFKSNKSKLLQNKDNNNNNYNKENGAITGGGGNDGAISVQRTNSKLKPVKDRRPTALPNEVPKIDKDNIDDDKNNSSDNGTDADPALKVLAKVDNNEDVVDDDDAKCNANTKETTLRNSENIINANDWRISLSQTRPDTTQTPTITQMSTPSFIITPTPTPTITTTIPLTPTTDEKYTKPVDLLMTTTVTTTKENVKFFIGTSTQDDDNISTRTSNSMTSAKMTPTTSLTPRTPPTPATPASISMKNGPIWPTANNSSSASLNYFSKKPSSSLISNGVEKPSNGHSRRRVSTVPDINIPPPPPMPSEPLIVGSPLRPRKMKKTYSTASVATTTSNGLTIDATNSDSNESTSSKINSKSNAADRTKFTFAELLNIASDDDVSDDDEDDNNNDDAHEKQQFKRIFSCFPSASLTGNYYNGSDSGVQIEDQLDTPKDSDFSATSPKSHRLEGGLIYSRPNPAKKDIEIVFIEKDEATRNLILTAIERNDFLNNLMDKERKEMVINAMAPANYDRDSYIICEKEEGSEIYVSAEGYYDVIKGGQHVGNFGPATVFGELAILYNAPRQATIRAATKARVWKISRETFRAIIQISGSREREENLKFLKSVPFLKDLNESVLNQVVDLLQRKFFETHSCIVREGEVGNEFFIIRGGTVTIKKKNEDLVEQVVDRRKRGDYFGEQALLNADRRQASVYADPPGTEVLMLDREAFISYLGTIPQLHEKPGERELNNSGISSKNSEFDNEHAHIPLSELKKVATLGAGAFGRVDLVTHGNKTFALKIIKKIDVVKQDQVEHIYNEKNVMIKCRSSPFIVELYRTYRNEKYVYFLMEACMGGDVWTVMTRRQYFDDKTAKFIAACVVEAFDFLHSNNFVYRDLKPENLMLTTDGYCKLVDFGFAKFVRPYEKTNTFAGTPEYVAPEIILDRGHDRAVDYWALGILIFELLVGKTPFRGVNSIKIYQQILSGIDVINMPTRIPKSAQGLIKHLCKQSPAERLGYQRRGIQDIKRHSWFDSLDWGKLKAKQIPSPIQRPIKSNTNLQYFEPPGIENDYEPPDELSGWDIDF